MRIKMDITVNSQMYVDLEDGRTILINIGVEGIIMDVYNPDGEDGEENTIGMHFNEWADWVTNNNENLPNGDLNELRRMDEKNGLYPEHEDIAN